MLRDLNTNGAGKRPFWLLRSVILCYTPSQNENSVASSGSESRGMLGEAAPGDAEHSTAFLVRDAGRGRTRRRAERGAECPALSVIAGEFRGARWRTARQALSVGSSLPSAVLHSQTRGGRDGETAVPWCNGGCGGSSPTGRDCQGGNGEQQIHDAAAHHPRGGCSAWHVRSGSGSDKADGTDDELTAERRHYDG